MLRIIMFHSRNALSDVNTFHNETCFIRDQTNHVFGLVKTQFSSSNKGLDTPSTCTGADPGISERGGRGGVLHL